MLSLADLCKGESAKILSLNDCDKAYRTQLLAMGLTRGTRLQVLRIAPLGDPIVINVRGASLSLRKHEAMGLKLERCE